MSFLSGLVQGAENLLGLNKNQQQKKKQQPTQTSAPVAMPQKAAPALSNNQPLSVQPTAPNALNLTSLNPNALKKSAPAAPLTVAPTAAQPTLVPPTNAPLVKVAAPAPAPTATLTPAQQKSAAFVAANGGPNPNYVSKKPGFLDVVKAALGGIVHSVADPAVKNYQDIQAAQAADNAASDGSVLGNLEATAKGTGAFIKGIGKTGAEYAGYAAPEIKGVEAAADAPALIKLGSSLIGHGATSAPLSVAGSLANGETDPTKIAEQAGLATLTAGGLPALKGLRGGNAVEDAAVAAPGEVAPGITSKNPAQLADVQAANLQKANAAPEPAPAPVGPQISAEHPDAQKIVQAAQAQVPEAPVTPPPVEPLPIEPGAMNDHENQVLQQLTTKAKTAVLTPEEKTTQSALQAKQDAIQTANAPVAPVAPEPAAPKATSTAPNAPGIRAAKLKTVQDLGDKIDAQSGTHDVLSNSDLTTAGKEATDALSDNEVVNQYKEGANFHGAADVARGNAAIDRLNTILKNTPDNADAKRALDNVMAGAEKEFSSGGRTTNYAQEFYNNLKGPAKVSYVMRQIDKAREAAGLAKIGDNVDQASIVDGKLTQFLGTDENIQAQISKLESQATDNIEAARNGTATTQSTAAGADIQAKINALKLQASKNTAELGRYYDSELVPPSDKTSSKIGNFTRSLMLSSPTGRVNDVLTTGLNSAHSILVDNTAALAGKVANKVTGKPGKFDSTFVSPTALFKGVKQGVQMSRARFAGNLTDANPSTLLKNSSKSAGKGGLSVSTGKGVSGAINRTVRAATEIATDLSEGVKNAKVQQMAANEGKSLGLTGENLKTYASNRTAAPSKEMLKAGENIKQTVNNMQDNHISNALGVIGDGLNKIPVIGPTLKNATIPFTRWTGGQLWNNLVDNNVAVSFGRAVKAAAKGDPQEAFNQAARTGVNTLGVATLGYQLSKAGLITHQNAEGYNDDGTYLHIGNRYIPLAFTGFFAPGLMLGSATHDTISDTKKSGNLGQSLLDNTVNTVTNSLKAYGAQSLTGQENPTLQAIENKESAGDVAATAGGQIAGQGIPAIGNDINAVLNNGIPGIKGSDLLDKTHEAALTKVTDPNSKSGTAKDVGKTVVNQLLNKIPIASQALPRKTGVAAADLLDRVTRGDRGTAAEAKAAADTATAASKQQSLDDRIKANLKAGIPDPDANSSSDKTAHYETGDSFDNAVESRIENGKYDQAQKGLEQKLSDLKASKDVTTKQTKPVEKQIAVVKTLKDGNYDPSIRDDYSGTSLSEWRELGNPKSDTYDPAKYQELYQYDSDLAKNGGSDAKDPKTNKFTAKAVGSGSGSGSSAASLEKSNTVGTPTALAKFDYSDLTPQKITSAAAKLPTITQIPASQLIKKRTISVSPTS